MSCLFCGATSHLPQNCDIYVSDESRINILRSNNLCQYCTSSFNRHHSPTLCKLNQKCFTCFSKNHRNIFCPERFTAPKYFQPAIDKILIPRFLQMFDFLEQYCLAFNSNEFMKLLNLKPLKILYTNSNISNVTRYPDANFVLMNARMHDIDLSGINFLDSTNIVIKAEKVIMEETKITLNNFLRFLLPNTKIIRFATVNLTSKLTFKEMLKMLPNIEDIEITETNIDIENSWPEDLFEFSKKLMKIQFEICSLDFNIENLANLFKARQNLKMLLYIDVPLSNSQGTCSILTRKLSTHFISTKLSVSDNQFLSLWLSKNDVEKTFFLFDNYVNK